MNPQRTGLLVSGAFHLGLLLLILFNPGFDSPQPANYEELSVSLQMFSAMTEIEQEQVVEQEFEPLPEKVVEQFSDVAEDIPKRNEVIIEKNLAKEILLHELAAERQAEQNQVLPGQVVDAESVVAVPDIDITYIRLLEEQYTSALKKAIEARKYFPAQARRLAREGDVVVAFKVSRSGDINNVRVVHSSSSRSLDRAAVNAVNSVGRFQGFPVEIKREWWHFEIALSYNLL